MPRFRNLGAFTFNATRRKRRGRNKLVTTNTLERLIAPAANAGFTRNPENG